MGMRSLRKDTSHLAIQKIPYLYLIPQSSVGSRGAGVALGAGALEKAVELTCL